MSEVILLQDSNGKSHNYSVSKQTKFHTENQQTETSQNPILEKEGCPLVIIKLELGWRSIRILTMLCMRWRVLKMKPRNALMWRSKV